MTRVRLLALAAFTAALACATAKPPPTGSTGGPLTPSLSPAGGEGEPIRRGMDAAEVRRRLGAPKRVEQVPSAAVHGTRYERWSYGAREVVLVDGKVIDVVP